jgi:hypothetical protein
MVQTFYEDLFSSEPCPSIDAVLESIPTKVTPDMNEDLLKPYTDSEIKAALFQMGPTKSPEGRMVSRRFFIRLIGISSKRKFVML